MQCTVYAALQPGWANIPISQRAQALIVHARCMGRDAGCNFLETATWASVAWQSWLASFARVPPTWQHRKQPLPASQYYLASVIQFKRHKGYWLSTFFLMLKLDFYQIDSQLSIPGSWTFRSQDIFFPIRFGWFVPWTIPSVDVLFSGPFVLRAT